jgi:hypothetical protein
MNAEQHPNRVMLNRGFRDAREQLWIPDEDHEKLEPHTKGWADAQQDALERTRLNQTLGKHCIRFTQFMFRGDGPHMEVEATYTVLTKLKMLPRPPEPPKPEEPPSDPPKKKEKPSNPAGRTTLSNEDNDDNDTDTHHGKHKEHEGNWNPHFRGSVAANFQVVCPLGTRHRRLVCDDGFTVSPHALRCRDGSPIPESCDPDADWRGGDHAGVITIVWIIVLICFALCLCGWCIYMDRDTYLGTGKKAPSYDSKLAKVGESRGKASATATAESA